MQISSIELLYYEAFVLQKNQSSYSNIVSTALTPLLYTSIECINKHFFPLLCVNIYSARRKHIYLHDDFFLRSRQQKSLCRRRYNHGDNAPG